MEFRGQRFAVDFSDDEEDAGATRRSPPPPTAFIGDIKEREVKAPSAPTFKATPNGFPEHKRRNRVSAFKQQRAASAQDTPTSANAFALPTQPTNPAELTQQNEEFGKTERRRIDEENRKRLANMSAQEIDEERNELLSQLDPSLVERLLKRANLDDGRGDTGFEIPSADESKEAKEPEKIEEVSKPTDTKPAADSDDTGVAVPKPAGKRLVASKTVTWEDDEEPKEPINLQPASSLPTVDPSDLSQNSVHFPHAPSAPELDPNDPSFLENLHTKYFPNLPADPTKLAWMAPIPTHGSVADQESPYYPAHEALPASALRFDFRGGILPPRISRAMPTSKGLHHHGEAPEAAGYTVPELARLARSAFPAQRCIAFQTLGRLLYRLGRKEWGDEDSEVTKGLWRCVQEGKVIQTLEEAASAEGGHQGSKVYAIEAVWLWQKGGGKVWKAS